MGGLPLQAAHDASPRSIRFSMFGSTAISVPRSAAVGSAGAGVPAAQSASDSAPAVARSGRQAALARFAHRTRSADQEHRSVHVEISVERRIRGEVHVARQDACRAYSRYTTRVQAVSGLVRQAHADAVAIGIRGDKGQAEHGLMRSLLDGDAPFFPGSVQLPYLFFVIQHERDL